MGCSGSRKENKIDVIGLKEKIINEDFDNTTFHELDFLSNQDYDFLNCYLSYDPKQVDTLKLNIRKYKKKKLLNHIDIDNLC